VGRFAGRIDAGFWLVSAVFLLAMKQQLPWEKYLFPTLAVLWTLVSLGRLSPSESPPTAPLPARTD
jgi:hypothetical protein